MTAFASCFFEGVVMHRRVRPKRHALTYRVFSALFDLDELPSLDRAMTGFGYNRAAPMSFRDRDHGPGSGDQTLKSWIEQHLRAAGLAPDGGPIRLLCYPRMFGFVFNPLSVYFCYRTNGDLIAIVHEVSNTFGGRHWYVIPSDAGADGIVKQTCAKQMYVSPFIGMDMTYDFKIKPPGQDVAVAITDSDRDGALLYASFHGKRRELSRTSAVKYLALFPLLTFKIIAGIHWEALKLWIKGVPLVARPAPPHNPISLIKS